ncbi:hypothetical protein HDU76_008360 [Blyttiomyces sp. JEL0837]|nr:hypothetical protein HDU76_008360 [Blyttiomyces sp. JEL0837]
MKTTTTTTNNSSSFRACALGGFSLLSSQHRFGHRLNAEITSLSGFRTSAVQFRLHSHRFISATTPTSAGDVSHSGSAPTTTTAGPVHASVIRQRKRRGESMVWTQIASSGSHAAAAQPSNNSQNPSSLPPLSNYLQGPRSFQSRQVMGRDGTLWTVSRVVDTNATCPSTEAFASVSSSLDGSPSQDRSSNPLSSTVNPFQVIKTTLRAVRDHLTNTFLPKSYPSSVTREYLPYTLWQFAHSVTGTITGTLSTQALLHALDGFGLLGGVLYAGAVASKFDSDPKRYRFLAAVAIQIATLAELLTPLVPHLFLPMASLSNVGKNVGWLASSATRAAIHRGFTKGDNLGDVTAKSGAQGTMAGLVGTVLGRGEAALRGWVLEVADRVRREKAAADLKKRGILEMSEGELKDLVLEGKLGNNAGNFIPTPEVVSTQENFVLAYRTRFGCEVELEPPVEKYIGSFGGTDALGQIEKGNRMERFKNSLTGERYRILVSPGVASSTSASPKNSTSG